MIPRITYHSVTVSCEENTNSQRRRPALWFFLVTGAAEHGEARIFWKARIGHRELAEKENGFAVRIDLPAMSARVTKARGGLARSRCRILSIFHEFRIRPVAHDWNDGDRGQGWTIPVREWPRQGRFVLRSGIARLLLAPQIETGPFRCEFAQRWSWDSFV